LEVNKVVHIQPKGEWRRRRRSGRIRGVPDETAVETRILERGGKTNGAKNGVDFIVPLVRAAAQVVKGTLEKPIFVWCCFGIAAGRTDDSDFIRQKNALAKGILTVTLTKRTARSHRHAGKKAKGILAKDGSKLLALFPNAVLMIPEDDDAGFGTERPEILILFDSKDTYCGDGAWSTLLTQGPIFTKSELGVSVKAVDATLLLEEAFHPNFRSGWVSANALRREGGQSRWRLTALTKEATESKVVGVFKVSEQRKECER